MLPRRDKRQDRKTESHKREKEHETKGAPPSAEGAKALTLPSRSRDSKRSREAHRLT
jgi:hypothetical protein